MVCSHGRAKVDDGTKLRLFGEAAAHCQRPECGRPLFVELASRTIHFAEMAHIIAASPIGPRGDEKGLVTSDYYENLILLCPTCHTMIDKAPDEFPDGTVIGWKREHSRRIEEVFAAVEYPNRASVRHAIEPLLDENRAIFVEYGPHNEYRMLAESESAAVWRRKMLSTIIPNNRKLLLILDRNRRHLREEERQVVEAFRQHVDDLEARHVLKPRSITGRRFPVRMNSVLKGPE